MFKVLRHSSSYILLFLFTISSLFNAQTPSFNFQKLGSEDGLTNANIFNIEQHQNGLLYFTTQNGIYYYDGYDFSKLRIDSLKSNALIHVSINSETKLDLSLREEGIARFDLQTKQLKPLAQLNIKDNNADNVILTDKFAYLLTSEIKIIIVDLQTGKILPDELKKKDLMNRPFCMFKTMAGKILLGRSDGLYDITDGDQKKLSVLNNQTVHSITQSRSGKFYIGTSEKIFIINKGKIEEEISPVYETKSATFQMGGERPIKNIVCDDFGRVWFTSYPNENLYLLENKKVFDVFDLLGIPPSLINCVFKDNEQNIWIGTYNDGVYFIQNSFFNSVSFTFNDKNLNINQVYLHKNLLVAATSNGLFGLNTLNGQTKMLSRPDETFLEPVSSIIQHNGVFYYAKRNQMNVAPSMIFDASSSYKFKPVIARQFYPLSESESVIADWDNANILLCNSDATVVKDTLVSFPDYRIAINTLLKIDQLLYIGTSSGLYIYDFKTGKCKNVVSQELNFNINHLALINNKLYAAHESGITEVYEGKLIQEIGPFRLNTVKKIKQFNEQIWLATLDGVFICDYQFNPLNNLNKSNGLLSNYINDIAFDDQVVSIATTKGVSTTLLKNIIRYHSRLKPVSINSISCNGQEVKPLKNVYTFKADEENVSVNFHSPLYVKPNKQFFRWRMDGAEWKYFNNTTFDVILTGGRHQIEISASSDNIEWSEHTTISILKEEKLSEQQSLYWLITLSALASIVMISFFWIRRVKIKSKKRLQEEQQVNILKHQAMNSLLSPHFIFNSLTSIQNYINTNNGLRASEYLAKFSRLIRMIIEKAAQSHISLYDELSRLTYYLELEKERFKNKFDYEIILDENIITPEIMIPNMIIQPFVENCIIHGILPKQEHGKLSISFIKSEKNKLKIIIEDNGIGLIKAKEHSKAGHKSLGTSTIHTILEINSKLSGKKQEVTMIDKSTIDPNKQGTLITIELEL